MKTLTKYLDALKKKSQEGEDKEREAAKAKLLKDNVQGFLVVWPFDFLFDEDLAPFGTSLVVPRRFLLFSFLLLLLFILY